MVATAPLPSDELYMLQAWKGEAYEKLEGPQEFLEDTKPFGQQELLRAPSVMLPSSVLEPLTSSSAVVSSGVVRLIPPCALDESANSLSLQLRKGFDALVCNK